MSAGNPQSEKSVFHLAAYFSGHVQGVGFRYQVARLARGFEVAGYVKNLADGRVLLEVEGKDQEVRAFLREIESEMDGYIKATEKKESNQSRIFFDFAIK